MNRNFARTEDGKKLIYAPSEFEHGGVFYNATNSEEIYNRMGYLKLIRSEMPEKEGFYFVPYYVNEDNRLLEKWQEKEIKDFSGEFATEDLKESWSELALEGRWDNQRGFSVSARAQMAKSHDVEPQFEVSLNAKFRF